VIAKNSRFVCDCKNYFVCVIGKTAGYFMIAKKRRTEQCVWLQLFCVCDCNQKLSVVAKPDCVCVVERYLIISFFMIARLSTASVILRI
jgi:hypothetical protein